MDTLIRIYDALKGLYKQYPALANSVAASAVVFAAAKLGIVVDEQSVAAAVAYALPIILLGGVQTHRKVTPVAK